MAETMEELRQQLEQSQQRTRDLEAENLVLKHDLTQTRKKNNDSNLTDSDVDRVLDEIDDKKESAPPQDGLGLWRDIRHAIRNLDEKKALQILEKNAIDIHRKDTDELPETVGNASVGKQWTLLMYAAFYGADNVVRILLSHNVDSSHADDTGRTAQDLARKHCFWHIEQRLVFYQMGGEMREKVQKAVDTIDRQNGALTLFWDKIQLMEDKREFLRSIVDTIVELIENRLGFSDDLLMVAWKYIAANHAEPFTSLLWKTIEETCEDVLSVENRCKRDWYWFQTYMLPSTIWLKEADYFVEGDEVGDSDEKKDFSFDESDADVGMLKSKLLFQSLMDIANREIEDLSDQMRETFEEVTSDVTVWDEFMSLGYVNEDAQSDSDISQFGFRQDRIAKGVKAEFSGSELNKYMGNITEMNGKYQYDVHCYLNKLIIIAHSLNPSFQDSIKDMFKIDPITHGSEQFKVQKFQAGPVKQLERCQLKAETEYQTCPFPTTAHIIDIIRSSLSFEKAIDLLAAVKHFITVVNSGKSAIKQILRVKNLFETVSLEKPNYADIKINCVIEGKHTAIIGEVQFLLQSMSEIKKLTHPLYTVLRTNTFIKHVKSVLPLIEDKKRVLYVAANLGSDTRLSDLLVTHGLPNQELGMIDEATGENVFHNICAYGHINALRFLLEQSPEDKLAEWLNKSNQYGQTPMYAVAQHGHPELAELVLNVPGVHPNTPRNDTMSTPLLISCSRGFAKVAQMILNAVDEKDRKDALNAQQKSGHTSLHYAAMNGHLPIVQWLLEQPGINPYPITQSKNNTPLMLACNHGREDVIVALLDGAAKDNKLESYIGRQDTDGMTAYGKATNKGFKNCAALIQSRLKAPK